MTAPEVILPRHAIAAIEEVVKTEKIRNFKLTVTIGSSIGDNFLGEIYRIVVNGKNDYGEDASISFIMKLSSSNEDVRKMMKVDLIYGREAFMYTTALPRLDKFQMNLSDKDKFQFAKLYASRNEPGGELLIMEDLTKSGFTMYDRLKPLDFDHLSLCIKNIARLHATTIALKIFDPEMYQNTISKSALWTDFAESAATFVDKLRPSIQKIIKGEKYEAKVNELMDNSAEEYQVIFDPTSALPYDVICHGDCWSNNMLFKYENGIVKEMKFIDWQLVRNSTPCCDIAYFIFTATDKETRAKHLHHLLDLYYTSLSSNLSMLGLNVADHYPDSVYKNHLKRYMRMGVLMSIIILPLTLGNRGESIEMSEFAKEGGGNVPEMTISETCINRLRGNFEDALKNDFF